ncbi:MAG: aromatic ring-hydroxylating dioxygenase subunit alpha [Betaproteobacteria bacterium]|nr:aromatic ring-hydroxylating dioxygenase subunit alpha [Betaproteobacteria bacterium]
MLRQDDQDLLTRTGPGTPMGELFRRFWLPALLAEELPGPDCDPMQLQLLGERLVAFKDSEGRIGILDEFCPHRRTSLFYGRNEASGLRCVYHGWKFDAGGACVDMPNEPPEYDFKHKVRIQAYEAVERAGFIWIYMGPKERRPALPDLEWTLVPADRRHAAKWFHDCNYLQVMEGDVDSSHVSFLHSGIGAKPKFDQLIRAGVSTAMLDDRAPRFDIRETHFGLTIGAQRNAADNQHYWRVTQWLLPFFALIPGPPGSYIGCNFRIPIDDERCWSFSVRWHPERPFNDTERAEIPRSSPEVEPGVFMPKKNAGNRYMIDRRLQRTSSYSGIVGDGHQQDLAITEAMGPVIDRTLERLGSSDSAVIAARKLLIKAAQDLTKGIEPFGASHPEIYRVRPVALFLPRGMDFVEGAGAHLKARSSQQDTTSNALS